MNTSYYSADYVAEKIVRYCATVINDVPCTHEATVPATGARATRCTVGSVLSFPDSAVWFVFQFTAFHPRRIVT